MTVSIPPTSKMIFQCLSTLLLHCHLAFRSNTEFGLGLITSSSPKFTNPYGSSSFHGDMVQDFFASLIRVMSDPDNDGYAELIDGD